MPAASWSTARRRTTGRRTDAAIEHYKGPFLDGDDADWVLQERERLHGLYVRTVRELMRIAARDRQYERALDYGRKILAVDPFRESVQREVMLLLVMDGQRANAIRAYQSLRRLLKNELGIDPMPDTKSLHESIVSGEIFSRLQSHHPVSSKD
jgi:DNA-binding SARP family transcriptional activator